MFFRSPKFWYDKNSKISHYLRPVSFLYEWACNAFSAKAVASSSKIPVICVGNVVIGGAGKTPTAIMLYKMLANSGFSPNIIASGYGGYLKNVVRVDSSLHTHMQVGDEAILLANVGTTWIGKNRMAAVNAAASSGAKVVIMDDGFQNKQITPALNILVVDSVQGFGNGMVFPAGPLREPIKAALSRADLVIIVGDKNEVIEKIVSSRPFFYVSSKATCADDILNSKVIAFCGIGYPDKFKKTLNDLNLNVVDFLAFADHHRYTIAEMRKLLNMADMQNAKLLTTTKDYVKIYNVFKNSVAVIDIELVPSNDEFERTIIDKIS